MISDDLSIGMLAWQDLALAVTSLDVRGRF